MFNVSLVRLADHLAKKSVKPKIIVVFFFLNVIRDQTRERIYDWIFVFLSLDSVIDSNPSKVPVKSPSKVIKMVQH